MKRIVYLITESGVDGRAKTSSIFASFDESELDEAFDTSIDKAWFSKSEKIVDMELVEKQDLAKLDAIDKLALGIKQKPLK